MMNADIDTSVSLHSLLLAIGVENKELEAELYVNNMEMSLVYNSLTMEFAEEAYGKHMKSANLAFASRMAGATGSAMSAGANGWGARKAGQFDPNKGSPEFQRSLEKSNANISQLSDRKNELASQPLSSGTRGEGQAATGANQDARTLGEIRKDDYDGWKSERAQLKRELEPANEGSLSPEDAATKRHRLETLDKNIKQYDELKGVEYQLGEAQSHRDMNIAQEQRRQAEQSQMKWRAIAEVVKAFSELPAGYLDRLAQVKTAEAGLDEAEQGWTTRISEAFSSLAQEHLSNSNGVDQYVNNAIQTTQQVIGELTKVG